MKWSMAVGSLSEFLKKGSTVAVDASVWIYAAWSSKKKQANIDNVSLREAVIRYSKKKFMCLVAQGYRPIIVFDGKRPDTKAATIAKRQKQGGAMDRMFKKNAETFIKKWLTVMSIEYVEAPEEAESQIVYLIKTGKADVGCTTDSDMLLYGVPAILQDGKRRREFLKFEVVSYYPGISQAMRIAKERVSTTPQSPALAVMLANVQSPQDGMWFLVKLAMMIGTDHNRGGITGVGMERGLDLMKQIHGWTTPAADFFKLIKTATTLKKAISQKSRDSIDPELLGNVEVAITNFKVKDHAGRDANFYPLTYRNPQHRSEQRTPNFRTIEDVDDPSMWTVDMCRAWLVARNIRANVALSAGELQDIVTAGKHNDIRIVGKGTTNIWEKPSVGRSEWEADRMKRLPFTEFECPTDRKWLMAESNPEWLINHLPEIGLQTIDQYFRSSQPTKAIRKEVKAIRDGALHRIIDLKVMKKGHLFFSMGTVNAQMKSGEKHNKSVLVRFEMERAHIQRKRKRTYVNNLRCACSCPYGRTGLCKHCGAILLVLESISHSNVKHFVQRWNDIRSMPKSTILSSLPQLSTQNHSSMSTDTMFHYQAELVALATVNRKKNNYRK